MKLTAFTAGDEVIVGELLDEDMVRPLREIGAFWRDPDSAMNGTADAAPLQLSQLIQQPAIPRTARVICVGLNYRLHAMEANMPMPEIPVIFARWAATLVPDLHPAPAVEEKFDWEGELGVVIGKRMFRVDAREGLEGIFGYAAFNDLSARTFQMQTPQWIMGKNSDASGPISAIATKDMVGDPADGLRLTTRVNDRIVQDSTTSDMIFSVGEIIAHLSQVMTLEPGDLIATGTPSGVGMALGQFLKPGDTVEVAIERIGRVRTPIVAI